MGGSDLRAERDLDLFDTPGWGLPLVVVELLRGSQLCSLCVGVCDWVHDA